MSDDVKAVKAIVYVLLACILLTVGAICTIGIVSTLNAQVSTRPAQRINLIGCPVHLRGSVAYGKVVDVIVNDAGYVEYAVVGEGEQLVTVPYVLIQPNYERRLITVDIDRDHFLKAPRFVPGRQHDFDGDFGKRVHEHFGVKPGQRPPPPKK